MKDHVTPESVSNQVRMLRTAKSGAILLVEGPGDSRFFRQSIDTSCAEIVIAHGKDNLRGAATNLDAGAFAGWLAVEDADFSWLNGTVPPSASIFRTDDHDLEIMLLATAAFQKLLGEFGSVDKIEQFRAAAPADIHDSILNASAMLGRIRWASIRNGWNLRFDRIDPQEFLSPTDLAVDRDKLADHIRKRSSRMNLARDEIVRKSFGSDSDACDPRQLACGHDFLEILSYSLRGVLGSRNSQDVSHDRLEESLRLAFHLPDFKATRLCESLLGWVGMHPAFPLFREF